MNKLQIYMNNLINKIRYYKNEMIKDGKYEEIYGNYTFMYNINR